MLCSHRLSFAFDPVRLRHDLDQVRADEWIAHFNKQDYDGGWSGISLRSGSGSAANINPGVSVALDSVANTPVLDRCPYFAEVLEHFHCPIRSARLLSLSPGSFIREHRDHELGIDDGEARIHVPIATNPGVGFFVNGERLILNPGEAWYINFNLPHRVSNQGATDRVHLVIDCVVNDWFLGLLPSNAKDADEVPIEVPRSSEAWQRFCNLVEEDAQLQEGLRDILDRPLFVSHIMKLGVSRNCRFAAADVEEALLAARQGWYERRRAQ